MAKIKFSKGELKKQRDSLKQYRRYLPTLQLKKQQIQMEILRQHTILQEKQAMGFQMSVWDKKLLAYGRLFEKQMMSLDVNIPLEDALDRGWRIMSDCFTPEETGTKKSLIEKYWPAR